MFSETTATRKILKLDKRIRLLSGGTGASKTVSTLLMLIDRAQSDTKPSLTSIVSESFPHLRKGAMRDFLSIMTSHNYYKDANWSKTDYTYTFETGSQMEFFSADQPGKVRGPRRDRLFVNELNNIPQETWEQLLLRTREFAIADWNPTNDFYVYEDYQLNDEPLTIGDDRVDFIILTYKDNETLEAEIVQDIERKAAVNKQWGRVYAKGLRGEVEGRVYKDWRLDLESIPHEARLERRGLDFGYTNDPTAIIDVYKYNGGFIFDERMFRKGLSNKEIADYLNNLPDANTLIIADSAEPKSIDELKMYGINVLPALKGPGSVMKGIQYVQNQRISVTKRSTNLIKEYRNYMFKRDKDTDKPINVPEDMFNHSMDAIRYALESYIPQDDDDKPYRSGNISSLFVN